MSYLSLILGAISTGSAIYFYYKSEENVFKLDKSNLSLSY